MCFQDVIEDVVIHNAIEAVLDAGVSDEVFGAAVIAQAALMAGIAAD